MKNSISNRLFLLFTFSSLFIFNDCEADICRVTTSGSSAASGSSWGLAKDLISALDDFNCDVIWLKSGTYYPTNGLDRNASFMVNRGTTILGGFYGSETIQNQRDPVNNKAILSGDIGLFNFAEDNSHHVVTIDAEPAVIQYSDAITTFDGIVIRDGYSETENGAGLYCDSTQHAMGCAPYLSHVEFINNVADQGGAIYIRNADDSFSDILISKTRFINNRADVGGAVYIYANTGPTANGPPYPADYLNINDSEFINNQADSNGGAMYIYHSSWFSSNPPVIDSSTFSWNSAANGGAIYSQIETAQVLPVKVQNSTFHYNSSSTSGGAIFNTVGYWMYENTTMTNNTAGVAGGAVYANGQDPTLKFYNNILWDNSAPSGNHLKADNNADVITQYNVIQGGCAGLLVSGTLSCANNQTNDPLLGQLRYNHELTQTRLPAAGSSAIDNGDNASCLAYDQRDFSRPQNGQCDIGSVEVRDACRVTVSGTNGGNGSNWGGEAMDLQTALSVANCPLVKIMGGTYMPTTSSDRTLSFNVPAGVTVQGGYDGTFANENNPDPNANQVILSGDIGLTNDNTDNSYHVVKLNGHLGTKILPSTVITDLEIHDGYSSLGFFDYPNNSGAGMYCVGTGVGGTCSPSIINVKFVNNQSIGGLGGGLLNDANNEGISSPQLINVRFENNAAYNGGAIYNNGINRGHSNPIVVNSRFINNTASNNGGAVYNKAYEGQSNGTFLLGYFSLNTANYGGAVYNDGQELGSSNPTFNQMLFFGNTAQFDGGAVYSAGWNNGQSKAYFLDVEFEQNTAQRGGGVFLNDLAGNETAEFNRVTFMHNQATDGAGLYNDGENGYSHPKLTNVTFINNVASSSGGGMYNNGLSGASSPTITNTTFFNNNANYGGAIYSEADSFGVSNVNLRNVIMWDNHATTNGPTIFHSFAESTSTDSIIENGCPNYGQGQTTCNNIIDNDPLFTVINNSSGHTTTVSLANNSPAIDAGNDIYCPGEDQLNQPRPNGLACDIGSVEVDVEILSDVIFKNGFE